MTYKIVKNDAGDVVAFGPNDGNYEPTLKDGETLTIESDKVAEDLIEKHYVKEIAHANQIANDKAALLQRLGITAEEAKLLLG